MRRTLCLIAAMAASSTAFAADRETQGNHYLPADKVPWVGEAGAPVQLGPLWGDRATGEAARCCAPGQASDPVPTHTLRTTGRSSCKAYGNIGCHPRAKAEESVWKAAHIGRR
jgi:hypothetical protein